MRVLVVDQDFELLTAITQSLGEYFTIDAVTTKADCLDLLRANEFEVIVAGERLEDGSGLELLGQLGKHRPGMLRIFAAERERLKLLKGRLGPFGLFRTLSYPIETRQLLAALSAAGTPDDADDMAHNQHVVLEGDGTEESPPVPAPVRPAAPTLRGSAAAQPIAQTRPASAPARPTSSPSGQSRSKAYGGAPPSRQASQPGARTPARKVRTAQAPRVSESDMAAATQGATANSPQRRPSAPQSARRSVRTSGTPASRLRAAARPPTDSLSEASRMAVAARSTRPYRPEDTGTKRSAFLVGAGVVVVLGVTGIAFKLFNASDESSTATTSVSVVGMPHYSAEVIKLVAETETALQQDDFKRARANVKTLQQIAPTHPRLSFFESLLRRHGDSSAAPPLVTSAPPERGPQRRPPTSASPPREPAQVRTATPPPTKSRPAGGADVSNTLSAARTSATAGQGARSAPPSSSSPSSPATFSGKLLEDSNSGAISQQRLTPSQAMATPAPGSSASLPVTRNARLIKHVSAEYPPSAANRGIEGVVDVALTVSRDGSVSDATVVHADPPDVFDHSAITAVRRWKYEPKTVDDVPVEARIQLRLQFKMDQHEP